MKRYLLIGVVGGLLGALLAVGLTSGTLLFHPSSAQELPWSPAPKAAGPTAVLADNATVVSIPQDTTPVQYSQEELIAISVYDRCNRAVVNIRTRSIEPDYFLMTGTISEGQGSGVVIDKQGHIVTNYHVVADAREINVILFDGMVYEGKMVGQDPATDIAVLKIDAPADKLFPLVFGDSTKLRVGQRVFAIGNPFGLERTFTTGVISSLNRTLPAPRRSRVLKQVIQVDAAINPGNSGGPLLDSQGRMIGMNTAIASTTGENAGVGFATPINTIARVVPQLIVSGRVVRADAGILRVYETEAGLLIAALRPGGAAERAGLRGPKIVRETRRQGPFIYESTHIDRSAADLIIAIDGNPVKSVEDYFSVLDEKSPGQQVVFRVLREGHEVDVPVILDAEP
ncbi:trypsin-like peptidase domain-containing protein [Thermostilla marina]